MCNKVALLANILSKTPVLLQSSIDLCFTHTPSVLEIEIVTIEIEVFIYSKQQQQILSVRPLL